MKYPANDPTLTSWIPVSKDSDFPIQNLPFGILQTLEGETHTVSAIGDQTIDLAVLAELGYFHDLDLPTSIFQNPVLNNFIALGKNKTSAVRLRLSDLLRDDTKFENIQKEANNFLRPIAESRLLLPLQIGDYTDFYSSRDHATNVGIMFRDPTNALLPNWLHLPVGYHGRASSIVVSDTPIHRPKGQSKPEDATSPIFGPSKRLDFELEMAFVVGKETKLGESVPVQNAEDFIFGLILFNDWSARDIQNWEYVPLGPFLGKNFASTLSPWIVTLETLDPFRIDDQIQDPPVLPYLHSEGKHSFDISLEVIIQPENSAPATVSRSNFKYMYWNMCQQLAHHTVNGCNIRVGDLCASGTISGPTTDSLGSMLEIAWKGTKPFQMPDGSKRVFLLDGDTVIMKGYAEKEGIRIGFGEASGKILPAI